MEQSIHSFDRSAIYKAMLQIPLFSLDVRNCVSRIRSFLQAHLNVIKTDCYGIIKQFIYALTQFKRFGSALCTNKTHIKLKHILG